MEYQKITNLLDDSSNKTSKFKTKNWVEINDESRGTYNEDKQIRFIPFAACKSNINNVEIDNCQDIEIITSMYSVIEYSDNYAKISGSLSQYYRDEPNDNLADSESFKSKIKINRKNS